MILKNDTQMRKHLKKHFHKCTKCNSLDKLEMHHIQFRMFRPDLEFETNNIMCLCQKCHKKLHADFKRNNKELFDNNVRFAHGKIHKSENGYYINVNKHLTNRLNWNENTKIKLKIKKRKIVLTKTDYGKSIFKDSNSLYLNKFQMLLINKYSCRVFMRIENNCIVIN